jgi:hypothetical protein
MIYHCGFQVSKRIKSYFANSWLLHFSYSHTLHEVLISLTGASIPSPFKISNIELLPILLVLGVIIVCTIIIYLVEEIKKNENPKLDFGQELY